MRRGVELKREPSVARSVWRCIILRALNGRKSLITKTRMEGMSIVTESVSKIASTVGVKLSAVAYTLEI